MTALAREYAEDHGSNPSAITVRELSRRITSLLSVPQTQNVWLTAELSDVRQSGGHCYMELIDKNEATGAIDARLRGIIWPAITAASTTASPLIPEGNVLPPASR